MPPAHGSIPPEPIRNLRKLLASRRSIRYLSQAITLARDKLHSTDFHGSVYLGFFQMGWQFSAKSNSRIARTIYVAACSNRKRIAPSDALRAERLPVGSQGTVVREWIKRIKDAPLVSSARDLYCGRSFSEATRVWQLLQVDPYVVSAGLGLVDASRSIPSYSLTLATASPDSIVRKINERFRPDEWWSAINNGMEKRAPLADIVRQNEAAIMVLALPEAYTCMIAADLLTLPDSGLSRVRLIGPRNASRFPEKLRGVLMPYDDRFDGMDSIYPGTRADFAQRAGRHFVEEILLPCLERSAEDHALAVVGALEKMARPVTVKRRSLSDQEIVALIEQHWDAACGQSSRMLRVLRDDLLVACEQKRFQRLFRVVCSSGRNL